MLSLIYTKTVCYTKDTKSGTKVTPYIINIYGINLCLLHFFVFLDKYMHLFDFLTIYHPIQFNQLDDLFL